MRNSLEAGLSRRLLTLFDLVEGRGFRDLGASVGEDVIVPESNLHVAWGISVGADFPDFPDQEDDAPA